MLLLVLLCLWKHQCCRHHHSIWERVLSGANEFDDSFCGCISKLLFGRLCYCYPEHDMTSPAVPYHYLKCMCILDADKASLFVALLVPVMFMEYLCGNCIPVDWIWNWTNCAVMLLHIANLRGSLGRVIIIVLVLIGLFWQIDLACLLGKREENTSDSNSTSDSCFSPCCSSVSARLKQLT